MKQLRQAIGLICYCRSPLKTFLSVSATLALFSSVPLASEAKGDFGFWSIGSLPGAEFSSHANAVSSDGRTVVGQSVRDGFTEAVLWNEEAGLISLGRLGQATITRATGVSHDGQVVVGAGYSTNGSGTVFQWTAQTGLIELPDCGCEGTTKAGADVSDDGTTVISTRRGRGFVWTAETGSLDIGNFPSGGRLTNPIGLTPDGSVIVGSGSSSSGIRGFRWSAEERFEELGELMYAAYAISADGSAISGVGFQDGQGAVRWTEKEGPVWLGHLPNLDGRPASFSSDISADGSVIVGGSGGDYRFTAFRWTEEGGMKSVESLLIALGADIEGWQLGSANAVSADGRVIVGSGVNPDGNPEGWVAVIPTTFVPEPSPFALLVVGTFAGFSSRWIRTLTA